MSRRPPRILISGAKIWTFPGQTLPDNLQATNDMRVLAGCDCVLMVAPAQFARNAIAELAEILPTHAMLVLCAKGVERGSLKFMSQLAGEYLPESRLAVLSGPSFAKDVAAGLPTAVTLAAADRRAGRNCAKCWSAGFAPICRTIFWARNWRRGQKRAGHCLWHCCRQKLGERRARADIAWFCRNAAPRAGTRRQAETLAGLSGLGDLV